MAANPRPESCGRRRRVGVARGALLVALGLSWATAASAYIGDSFVNIPGVTGHWRGQDHKHWIRAEASEWTGRLRRLNSGAKDALAGDKLYFGGPNAARPGNGGKLVLMLDKGNLDLPRLMELCTKKTEISELTYAESSDRARPLLELGPRPARFPNYWEYKLKKVTIADCPVLENAKGQALVLAFKDIEWLNYDPKAPLANKVVVDAKDLPPVSLVEETAKQKVKAFLITWIGPAVYSADDQCPVMNAKPSDADVFRYLSKEEADRLRAQNGEKGVTAGTQSELRGPHRLNVNTLPAIIPDPGFAEPQTTISEGVDLDGNDGVGAPPKGVRKHKNFTAPDGRKGVDNQLMRIFGCVPGFQGKKGYRNQTSNARRADGNVTTLIQVSGIDDEQNDKDVDVSIIYSMDKPIRDNAGTKFIPNYTFRPSDDPNFALYNVRLHGRIVNGVVTTDPLPLLQLNLGQDPLFRLFKARLRLQPQPDGSMKGALGGYLDWRVLADAHASGYSEGLFGYQQPGLYNALKRNADGLQDPATGEFNGISAAYEIDTVPAFLTPADPPSLRVAEDHTAASKKP